MSLADIFEGVVHLFTRLQLITGLSPLSTIFFLIAMWNTAKSAWSRNDSTIVALAEIAFYALIWWLVGYLLLNPIWNIILGRL